MNAPSLLLHNATLIDGSGAGPRPGVSVLVLESGETLTVWREFN